MITSSFEYVDKLIAIVEACQTEFELGITFSWSADEFDMGKADNGKVRALRDFADKNWLFQINKANKERFLRTLADTLVDSDFSHYHIRAAGKLIGKGFDHCEINFLDPTYFRVNDGLRARLGESELNLKEEIERD